MVDPPGEDKNAVQPSDLSLSVSLSIYIYIPLCMKNNGGLNKMKSSDRCFRVEETTGTGTLHTTAKT